MNNTIQLELINDFQLDPESSQEINALLQKCFVWADYQGRDYYKQLPHYRILAKKEGRIIGHLGMDYRVMNLNGSPIKVLGTVDLCVDPAVQGLGIGKAMIQKMEQLALSYRQRIDFLFLVSEVPGYYEGLGYQVTELTTTWLKIHQHQNYGVGKERITDATFLYKAVGDKVWEDGELDLLGYMY